MIPERMLREQAKRLERQGHIVLCGRECVDLGPIP